MLERGLLAQRIWLVSRGVGSESARAGLKGNTAVDDLASHDPPTFCVRRAVQLGHRRSVESSPGRAVVPGFGLMSRTAQYRHFCPLLASYL